MQFGQGSLWGFLCGDFSYWWSCDGNYGGCIMKTSFSGEEGAKREIRAIGMLRLAHLG